jgi:hypothetical protein
VARELGAPVTTHAGVWGATSDAGIRLMHDTGFATDTTIYVHAATLNEIPTSELRRPAGDRLGRTESEQTCGQGYPPTWTCGSYDIPVALSVDTSVWWSATSSPRCAARSAPIERREHLEAHARASTVTNWQPAADQVVEWATIGGAKALGLDCGGGRPRGGQEGRRRSHQERPVPGDVPDAAPYGHVVFQAQRGDVHTVLINGGWSSTTTPTRRNRPRTGPLDGVESTVEYLQGQLRRPVEQ